jgi:hypothetical protein
MSSDDARDLPGLSFLDTVVRLPLLTLPVRTTLVELEGVRLLVSPGSKATDEQLRGLGPITDVVAPSLLHTAGVPRAARVFPEARVWGPKGAAKKHPEVRWTGTLGEDAWQFDDELALFPIDGAPRAREFVLLHRRSRTLLVMDLAFNLVDARGPGARLLLSLAGTWRRFAVSRLFLSLVKDRAAFDQSLARILEADFDHLAPAHGAIVRGGARERLAAALRERGFAVG